MTALEPKVFGLGLSKTGTTTLGESFELLGLTPCAHPQLVHDCLVGEGPPEVDLRGYAETARFAGDVSEFGEYPHRVLVAQVLEHANYALAIELARHFRSFEDRPWNIAPMYRLLDEAYPGSRFVLTRREPERWWRSVEQWLLVTHPHDEGKTGRYLTQLKAERIEREAFIAAYRAYDAEVRGYFAGRDDFLAIDFEAGEGWEPLCTFLGLPVPDAPFPHANRQEY